MAKQHLLMLGLLLGGSIAYSACSSDSDARTGNGGDAGAAGESSAGAAGSTAEAGSVGDAGAAGAPVVPPAPLNPQTVIVTAAEPATSNHLLVASTDYMTATTVGSVALDTGTLEDPSTFKDQDTIATSSAGLGFAVERSADKVNLLEGSAIKITFDLKDLGTGDDVALANKAYVPVLSESLISVLDLKAGTVSKRIDLNKYNAASDSDGSADISAAVYDATKKIAYFVLGRIDFGNLDASYHVQCSTAKALVVGIDANTDEVIDLNGDAAGEAAELELANPGSVSLAADGSLVILSSGCYTGAALKSSGVEVLDTTAGTSVVAYASTTSDYLGALFLTSGSQALIGASDSVTFTSHWYKLDLEAGKLGDELLNVPDAVSFDGKDLLGVDKTGAVVRYDIATGTSTTVSATQWVGKYSNAASTALVK
jgi:hypothetical protein